MIEAHLYHATQDALAIGTEVRARTRASGARVEDALETHRPARCHQRSSSFFACAGRFEAWRYLSAQLGHELSDARLYRVSIPGAQRHPMALVDAINARLGDIPTVRAMIDEYWCPTHDWSFWEYLGPAMTVEERVEPPDAISASIALLIYQKDKALIQRLWPRP